MKKTLLICIALILLATAGLVTVIVLKNPGAADGQDKKAGGGKLAEEMTFEQFTEPMIDDMSAEMMDEVERLYKVMQNAQSEQEAFDIYEELINLGVYGDDKELAEKKEYDKNEAKGRGGK